MTSSGADAAGFAEEAQAFGLLEVAVEVAREDTVEGAVGERQPERVRLDEAGRRHPRTRELEHARALVEAGDAAGKVLGQKARAARDVERAHRFEGLQSGDQRLHAPPPSPAGTRSAKRPVPSHQSSYSGALAS